MSRRVVEVWALGLLARSGFGAIAVALFLPGSALGQPQTGFLNRVVVDGGVTRRYQVYVPFNYTPTQRWPVILFLHGGGAQGDDGLLQTEGALASAIRVHPERWPAIVVFPQARMDHRWNGEDAAWALRAVEQTQSEFATDTGRVYLTGLSRGGEGAWWLAYRNPARFAAVLVLCGRVSPGRTLDRRPAANPDPVVPLADGEPFAALAARLRNTPVWVYHGAIDETIPVEESQRAVAALRKVGAPVRYSELPHIGHNVWDFAYDTPEVIRWLFSHRSP